MLEVVYSLYCFCGSDKMKYQSMCDDCCQKLPREIKFELWRPLEDGFEEVFKDALKYILALGVEVEEILYDTGTDEVY